MTSSDALPLLDALAEQFLEQLRAGEQPRVDDFVARHPELAEQLRDLLPTLQFMEDFKPRSDDEPGEPEPEEPPRPLPERVGEYRILKEIGRGGMGVVYEAEQLSLGRHVALKVLPQRATADGIARERFQREARAAAQLHHPNIVPIIDIGAEHDVNYYAMQFIRGRSLHELQDDVRRLRAGGCAPSPHGPAVQDGRIDTSSMGGRHYWQSIARIGRQVCKALAYAHQQGVVHRDIKPSNLMLDEQGNVWVTDFGLAKTADDGLTVTGDVVGTLRFMSPERFRGQCDERADVFSVGATLYELLALHPAFHSPDRLHLIQSIQRDEPKPLRETDPTIPVDLETIVCKALEKDPRRRYQTAAEMGDDLGRFLDREPIRARRTSALGRLLRWAARNRALAAAIAGLVTLLLITAVSSVIVAVDMRQLAREADDARLIAERQLYGSQLQSASEAIASGRVRLARQRLLATPPHMRGWEWRHLHSRLDRSVGTVFDQRLPIAGLQFTSTGDRALVRLLHGNGYRIQVLAADGASLADLTHEPGVANAALLGDHHAVTIGRELVRWDLREGEIVHREPSAVRFAAPLDERHYLVGTYSGLQRRRLSDDTIAQRIDRPAWWATIRPGRAMLVAGFDRELALFDPSTLEPLPGGVALPDRGSMLSGRLSADGRLLACTTASGSALLFAFVDDALQLRHELRGFLGSPTELAFSRDARHVMLGTTQGGIYAWDCASGELAHQFHDHDAAIIGLCVHPVTDHVVSCDSRGRHHSWSFEADTLDVLRGHESFVYSAAFSADGERILSGGWDGFRNRPGSLRVWDARTGRQIAAHVEPGMFVRSAAFADDDRLIAVALHHPSGTGRLAILDATSGRELRRFDGHGKDSVAVVRSHPDGRRIVTVGVWERAILWDVHTGEVERSWPTGGDGQLGAAAAFSPDGRWLALAKDLRDIALFDLRTQRIAATWRAHTGGLTSLAFTADSRRVLSTSTDDTVGVFELDGRKVAGLTGHGLDVLCVAASPDGRRIASGGRDGNVLVWAADRLDLVARLEGHRDYIHELAWSPDGERLVTASGDGTLRLWTTETLASRTLERRARRGVAERLQPQMDAWLADDEDGARTRARIQQADWTPRERAVAMRLLLGQFGGR